MKDNVNQEGNMTARPSAHLGQRVLLAILGLLLVAAGLAWLGGPRIGIDSQWLRAQMERLTPSRGPRQPTPETLRGEIAKSGERVEDEAQAVAKLAGRIRAVDRMVQQKRQDQQDDEILLDGLRQRLVALSADQQVTIDGRTWTRPDLEHEARVILNRHGLRAEQVQKLGEHRQALHQQCEYWRRTFRDHRTKLDELNWQERLAAALTESLALTQSLAPDGWQETERVLDDAAHQAASLIDHLEIGLAKEQAVEGLYRDGATPAADAIRIEFEDQESVETQIQRVLQARQSDAT